MQLADLKIGSKGRILSIKSMTEAFGKAYRSRLIAMGLIPGTPFEIKHIAPLGDPVEITVRGVDLCVRKNEANIIEIELEQGA